MNLREDVGWGRVMKTALTYEILKAKGLQERERFRREQSYNLSPSLLLLFLREHFLF